MGRDDVGMNGLLQHLEAVFEIHFPEWLAEFGERVATLDIVDENIEVFMLPLDLSDKLFHFSRNSVIYSHGDA